MLAQIKVMQKLKGCANIVSIEDSALVERQEGLGYAIYIRMEYLIPLLNYLDSHPRLTDADMSDFMMFLMSGYTRQYEALYTKKGRN